MLPELRVARARPALDWRGRSSIIPDVEPRIGGILPVIPTPFSSGSFDRESFERLLDHALPSIDGYTLLGSTGEAPSLTTDERIAIAEKALALTPRDKPVVIGVSHTSVREAIRLARHAQAEGASAVLCAAPSYFENTPAGLFAYFAALDAALEIDLILYDNPVATKTQIEAEWVTAWAEKLEHLRAVKLTDHDLTKIPPLQAAGLEVFAGDDAILFRYLAAGVDGVMVIAPAIVPDAFRIVYDLAQSGELERSLEVFEREILPLLHVFGIGDEIATTKAILADVGIFTSHEVLPPLTVPAADRCRLLRAAYELCRSATADRLAQGSRSQPETGPQASSTCTVMLEGCSASCSSTCVATTAACARSRPISPPLPRLRSHCGKSALDTSTRSRSPARTRTPTGPSPIS
jgi:4-hydroxy-tetrahydrodipicolinate synthase